MGLSNDSTSAIDPDLALIMNGGENFVARMTAFQAAKADAAKAAADAGVVGDILAQQQAAKQANDAAQQALDAAMKQANDIIAQAQAHADGLKQQAQQLVDDAQSQANQIVLDARTSSDGLIASAQHIMDAAAKRDAELTQRELGAKQTDAQLTERELQLADEIAATDALKAKYTGLIDRVTAALKAELEG